MLDLETRIKTVLQDSAVLRKNLVKQVMAEYLKVTLSGDATRTDHHATAVIHVRAQLKQGLFSPDCLSLVDSKQAKDPHWINALALAFDAVSVPLTIPLPVSTNGPRMLPVAVAGLTGAVIGMMVFTPLARLALDMRDLGLALGGPLGAFLAIMLYWRLSGLRLFQWVTGRSSTVHIDTRGQQAVARLAIEQWLDLSLVILVLLCDTASCQASPPAESRDILRQLSRKIYALHRVSQDSLAVCADEVIQAARNLGFEGLDGQPEFMTSRQAASDTLVWHAGLTGQYEPFGHLTDGDPVRIERKPVVLDGKVMERGLVRKVRK